MCSERTVSHSAPALMIVPSSVKPCTPVSVSASERQRQWDADIPPGCSQWWFQALSEEGYDGGSKRSRQRGPGTEPLVMSLEESPRSCILLHSWQSACKFVNECSASYTTTLRRWGMYPLILPHESAAGCSPGSPGYDHLNVKYVNANVSVVYALKQKFSEEGVCPCESMGLQPISELFTTDGG